MYLIVGWGGGGGGGGGGGVFSNISPSFDIYYNPAPFRIFYSLTLRFKLIKQFCAKDLDQVLYYKINIIIDLYANDVNYDSA